MPQYGNKAFTERANVRNDEITTILAGTPLVLVLDGSEDGFAVVKPSTAGATKATNLFFGIASKTIAPNEYGMSVIFGWVAQARYNAVTRSATTASFATFPAVTMGQKLTIDTVADALGPGGVGAGSDYFAGIVAAQSLAAGGGIASATSDTRTALTVALKAFVRAM